MGAGFSAGASAPAAVVADFDRVGEGGGDMVGGDDLGGRARGHGVAVGDEQGVGGGARKFLEVMGDQDRGDLGV